MPYPPLSHAELIRRQSEHGPGAVAAVKLRERREQARIPAPVFAAEVGLSPAHYRNIEAAKKQPSPAALLRIAERLGCDPSELLAGSVAA